MSQRGKNPKVTRRGGLIVLALLLALAPRFSVAQDRSSTDDSRAATTAWRVAHLETNSVIAAALCFAVGFGACWLVVHSMLPSLVHAQCVEIVREYLDLTRRESDIRVVVLDRESHVPLQKPRRASVPVPETPVESSYELQQHLRVDQPAPPTGPASTHNAAAPNSMLAQIYEQNLHLRDQLRKQSRSVKQ